MSPSKVLCVAVLVLSLLSVPSSLNAYCAFDSIEPGWTYVGYSCVYDSECEDVGSKCLVETFTDGSSMFCVRRGCNCS